MNSTVIVKKGRAIAQPREQRLNEAILKVGVTADVERCLKVFDEFMSLRRRQEITKSRRALYRRLSNLRRAS